MIYLMVAHNMTAQNKYFFTEEFNMTKIEFLQMMAKGWFGN